MATQSSSACTGCNTPLLFPSPPGFVIAALVLLMAVVMSVPEQSHAEDADFSSSMNPVGSGARATGMGGAFIAVADDATAASWNPAGLIHLEKPEVSMVHSYFNRSQTYHSWSHPEMSGSTSDMDADDVNFASVAIPFTFLKRNMVVTFNYQRLFDMTKQESFRYNFEPLDPASTAGTYSFEQQGYIGAFSPAIAIQVLPELYFGATVNIYDDFAGTSRWRNRSHYSEKGTFAGTPYSIESLATEKFSFSGLNANLGLLYTLNGKFSFGFVYKTAFDADVTKESSFESTVAFEGFPPDITPPDPKTEKLSYSMPASYGLGFAYRHSDSLTVALDVYRTEWSTFAITDSKGVKTNPISKAPLANGKPNDTTQVRLGAEYLFIGDKTVIPVRAGLFYDPEPGNGKINDFWGCSVGSGIAYNNLAFDFSYQYRFGNRVTSDVIIPSGGINMDVTQHTVMTSLIYHF